MFGAPPELRAEVFATLPDAFRLRGQWSRWARVQGSLQPMDSFLEGPAFGPDGSLYVVDIPWGRIFRISPTGEFELFCEYDGEPNGLKFHRDGRMFVADFRRGLMAIDPRTRRVETVLSAAQAGFKGLNDLHFASNGDLYFTDQGLTGLHDPTGRVWRLRADGRLDLLLDNVPSPNGLALNATQNVLYVNVTRGNCIWRVPMDAEGRPFKVGLFVQLSGGSGGPDGLAVDGRQGNLAVAHIGLGTVWLLSPTGEPLLRIRSPAGLATTNVAYQGHLLYITESETGTVLRVELP